MLSLKRSFLAIGLLLSVVVLLVVPNRAAAGKVKVWHHHTPAHHEKSRFDHAVISNEGTLRLARELRPWVALDAVHVWDIAEDQAGNLFVATGNEGKVYKVTPEGKVSVALDTEDSQVLCLAVGPDGAVFAGTGPSGLIVRIAPDGNTRVILDTPERYIWSLAIADQGKTIYAGTGPQGRIYRLMSEGRAGVFYTTKQEHILSLALGTDGLLYAGTDKDGLIYRIDAKGKGFVVHSVPQSEVRRLVVTEQGIYAGTSAPTKRLPSTSSSSTAGSSGTTNQVGSAPPSLAKNFVRTHDGEEESSLSSRDQSEPRVAKSNAAPAPSEPASGENSLYRIAPDGSVREVFREKALVLSLLQQQKRFYIGTGGDGKLFEVDETTKEACEIARLDHGQIQAMCRRHDGSIVLGAGDPGKLYVLEDKFADKGTVLSEVLDAKMISKWGALTWQAQVPSGTRLSIATRSGNLAEPDETWSDWSEEMTDSRQSAVTSPTARFLQYRVTLTTTDTAISPTLRDVTLRYLTTNQAPEITKLEVPNLDAENLDNPKKLKLKWSATDANEDELTYHLYTRKVGWKDWVLLEEDWSKAEYEWDTTTTPSGYYHVKVVASDRKDNPQTESLTGERIAGPFVVNHTPPTVKVEVAGQETDRAVITANVESPLVRLTEAAFSVNGKKWVNVFPSDDLFDSRRENFRFQTDSLKPGTYVLVLRVRDAAGNVGLGDTVFTVGPRTLELPSER